MYAIIATGGKQYTVSEGDVIKVEKLGVNAGDTVTFDQVLFVNDGDAKVGNPTEQELQLQQALLEKEKTKRLSFTSTREKLATIRKMVTDSFSLRLRLKRLTLNYLLS